MTPLEVGLVVYAVLVSLLYAEAKLNLRTATERLYGAWKDGAIIPPAKDEDAEPEHVDSPMDGLPHPVLEWVLAQEGIEVQERWARRAHVLMAKYRGNVVAVISELDTPNF